MENMLQAVLTAVGTALLAILGLMLVARLTSRVKVEGEGTRDVFSVEAKVLGKRQALTEEAKAMRYFVTFQKMDGNRVELPVPGEDYGLLAEGDEGILVVQGEDYMVFHRT